MVVEKTANYKWNINKKEKEAVSFDIVHFNYYGGVKRSCNAGSFVRQCCINVQIYFCFSNSTHRAAFF